MSASASCEIAIFSFCAIDSKRAINSDDSMRLKSNRWQRESMVTGTLRISVVAKDELHVRRRLFQRLEDSVEGRPSKHVHFVEDVDLVARAGGGIAHASMI